MMVEHGDGRQRQVVGSVLSTLWCPLQRRHSDGDRLKILACRSSTQRVPDSSRASTSQSADVWTSQAYRHSHVGVWSFSCRELQSHEAVVELRGGLRPRL
uniref:Uncharacterized protein n=1 Tax=Physcomitrium patens TaxID=3218 RepID=A0A2K1K7R6_PHYPA|nr:hypothetical protein PHYPA_011715 [Physcomitrium patens]